MEIDIKLEEGGIMPTKEFETSIGFDLFIPEDTIVEQGRNVIPLNFRLDLPKEYGALLFARSGTSAKGMKGLNIYDGLREMRFNCDVNLGLIDPNYKGIVGLMVNNHGSAFKLPKGSSVAQMMIIHYDPITFRLAENYTLDGERGEQGFNA